MLLHIFLYLINRMMLDRRKRRVETLIIHCPRCDTPRKARKTDHIRERDEGMVTRQQVDSTRLRCEFCGGDFDAEAFAPDTMGVLHVKQWDCPECKAFNPATDYRCRICGFSLV